MRVLLIICFLAIWNTVKSQNYELLINSDISVTNAINSNENPNLFYSLQSRNQISVQIVNILKTKMIVGLGGTLNYILDENWISGYSTFDEDYPLRYGLNLNGYVGVRILKNPKKLLIDLRINNFYFLNKNLWIKNGVNRFYNEFNLLLNKSLSDNLSLGLNFSVGLRPPFKGEINIVGSNGILHIDEFVDVFALGLYLNYNFYNR